MAKLYHYITKGNTALTEGILNNLLHNLNELYSLYEEFDNKEAINRNLYYLIDKGQRIITKRILSYL